MVSRPGAYESRSSSGLFTLVLGAHGPGESPTPAQHYVKAMEGILDKHAHAYNPLEHPLNKYTFAKSFEDAEKILKIRSKLDPQKLFFGPSTAEPSH